MWVQFCVYPGWSPCIFAQTLCPENRDVPYWGVWCLFEFFLSSREHLELVFVTYAGVVGDAAWPKLVCLKKFGTRQPAVVSMRKVFAGLSVQMLRASFCSYHVVIFYFFEFVSLCKSEAGPDGLQKFWKAGSCLIGLDGLAMTWTMFPLLQDGCSSFDIALEVGKKIESLQVETCGASWEDDKKLDCTQIRTFHSSWNEKLPLTPC